MLKKNENRQWRLKYRLVLACVLLSVLFPVRRVTSAPPLKESAQPFAELPVGTTQSRIWHRFSPDSSFLATWGAGELTIWSLRMGEAVTRITDRWSGFEFCNDGKRLAVWTNQELSILDTESGSRLARLGHRDIASVHFFERAELMVTETSGLNGFERRPSRLKFWSTKTWEQIETKLDRNMPLIGPTFSSDGKYLAGFQPERRKGKNLSKLKLWEVETGQELPVPKNMPDSLRMRSNHSGLMPIGIGFTHDGNALYVGGVLWDIEAAELKPVFPWFDIYRDVNWPDSSMYARPELSTRPSKKRAAIIDDKIVVWDSYDGEPIAELVNPVKEQPVNTITYMQNSVMRVPWVFDNALAFTTKDTNSSSNTIDIWDISNEKITRSIVLDGLEIPVEGQHWQFDPESPMIRVAKDGKTIVVLEVAYNVREAKRTCSITAYDFATGKRKFRLKGHNDFVSALSISPDSRLIATGSGADKHWDANSGEVKLWDLESGALVRTVIAEGRKVHCLAFDNQGRNLAVSRNVGNPFFRPEISVWQVSTGTKLLSLQRTAPEEIVHSPAGIPYKQRGLGLDETHSLAFSPDDRLLVVGGNDRLSLWNMPAGNLRYIGPISGPVDDVQFSSDGSKIYFANPVGCHLQEVQIAQLHGQQGFERQLFRPTDATVGINGKFAIDATGQWIASCSASWHIHRGEISLWSVRDREIHKIICHDGVRSVQFMADGQLITGSLNPDHFTTVIINPTTGQIIGKVRQPGIKFSPSGELFATLNTVPRHTKLVRHRRGYLKAVRTSAVAGIDLWDTRSGRKLIGLPHESSSNVLFSPDGKTLASVGPASIKLWWSAPQNLIQMV